MKISILLPYKENFSSIYAGAVSLYVKDTVSISKFKKSITVYGSTNYKEIFKIKYKNLSLPKRILSSQSKNYVKEFLKEEYKAKSDIIEIHNRPNYVNFISAENLNIKIVLYFHNDPHTMSGSKTLKDRKILLMTCSKIIFNSQWSKKRFLEGLSKTYINSEKLLVIYQSAEKKLKKMPKKKKWITFVGKLNRAKGYDIFGKAIIKILKKYKDWQGIVIGDELRDKLIFEHKNLKRLGFLKHQKVLNVFKKTSIAVACSRWDEPFGRTSLEASNNGCAVIISNRGGLPETVTNAIILKELSVSEVYNKIKYLINNPKIRKNYQSLSLRNFYLTHEKVSKEIDNYRREILTIFKKILIKKNKLPLRILHVTNFNERHNGRLFFNSGRRINNGFVRLKNSVLEFSDRDIQKYYKSYKDINGTKSLNEKLIHTCYNIRPDLIVLGHADSIYPETLDHLKSNYPDLKIAQWFLDPLNKDGPDYAKNKKRILNKEKFIDANFLTTSPDAIDFLPKDDKYFYIPNPSDSSFETLNNFKNFCSMDVFFALSHGVHRGVLKRGKYDDRASFVKKLIDITPNIKFDIYGLDKIQPIWADNYIKSISNSKMGLNLSRGKPIKYYSSDRITQLVCNGLLTFINEKTMYGDFFNKNEMVFYKNIDDLSEKILKYTKEDKLRRKIAENGKKKYMKYFNSSVVAKYIINKTLGIDYKKGDFLWSE